MMEATTILNPTKKWLYMTLIIICLIVLFGFTATVNADGATQISGVGYLAEEGECTDAVTGPAGQPADFAIKLEGDLVGCQYIFVETYECSPSGTYRETGAETYVLDGPLGEGTFRTTYIFEAKFEGCSEEGFPLGNEIFGRCQHPIAAGSGTGDYEGVTGRLDFKDDVSTGAVLYRGHLRY